MYKDGNVPFYFLQYAWIKMESAVEEVTLSEFREFGHKCFSISSFLSFILIIVNTIVNVNNNLVSSPIIS